jgi:hypothetical protein
MLALIALFAIWTGTMRLLGNGDSVDITSRASNVKDFLFVSFILTDASLSVNQEHSLRLDTIQTFKIGERSLLAKDAKALLFTLLSDGALWLAGLNAG